MVSRVGAALAAGAVWAAALACAGPASAQTEEQGRPGRGPLQIASLTKIPLQYSSDCKVKNPAFEGRAPLRAMRKALRDKRPVKVMAIGSSSTVGVGASSPVATYPIRLENDLEGFLTGVDVHMLSRGISGEIAQGAAERLKLEVAETRPDLVVWQVGTNDALARIDDDDVAALLRSTLRWLAGNRIDVVLIDPQYVDRFAKDEHYLSIVKTITDVAREERVLLVHRFAAMADLAKERGNGTFLASDRFHLNDLGYRCMAEYAARAIVSGILQAESEATPLN